MPKDIRHCLRHGHTMGTSKHMELRQQRAYTVSLLIIHERSDSPTGVGAVTSLAANTNGGVANAELVNSAGNSVRRGRH